MTGGTISEGAGSQGADASRGPTLGRASAWSRDLAIVGAATSFGAMFGVEHQVKVDMLVAAGVGGVVGALFGAAFRRLLLARLHQQIGAWIPVSLFLGALFGATVGLVTPLLMRERFGDGYFLSALFGDDRSRAAAGNPSLGRRLAKSRAPRLSPSDHQSALRLL